MVWASSSAAEAAFKEADAGDKLKIMVAEGVGHKVTDEQRRERMLSPAPDDNRITFGCINLPKAFYGKVVRPLFQKKGGYVYVLPDTKPLEAVFPLLHSQPVPKVVASGQ